MLLCLLGLTQLCQTLLVEKANLVEELLAPLLEQLLLLLLLDFGRSCSTLLQNVVEHFQTDLLALLDLVKVQRQVIAHQLKFSIHLDVQLLSRSSNLDVTIDFNFQITNQTFRIDIKLQSLPNSMIKVTQVLNFNSHL